MVETALGLTNIAIFPTEGRLWRVVPEGREAEVIGLFGRKRSIKGPKTLFPWIQIRPYREYALGQGAEATLVDADGAEHKVEGPQHVHVHPDGKLILHDRVVLPANMKAVLLDEGGEYLPMEGPKVVHVPPRAKLLHCQPIQLKEHEASDITLGIQHALLFLGSFGIVNGFMFGSARSFPTSGLTVVFFRRYFSSMICGM